jgi:uncharacterized protein DUF4375
MPSVTVQAWNNFVMRSDPSSHEQESSKRAAAIACLYMGLANNGGLNSFLTSTCDLDASEVVDALTAVGANLAARQLEKVVQGLGKPLHRSSQEERWNLLEQYWTEELDDFDVHSSEADAELFAALERHVRENEAFYLGLG